MKQRASLFLPTISFLVGGLFAPVIAPAFVRADVAAPCVPQVASASVPVTPTESVVTPITITPKESTTSTPQPPPAVRFSELLPDPVGDDAQEFIELRNDASEDVALAGWKIADTKGHAFTVGDVHIAGNSYLTFLYAESKIRLTNTGASYTLASPDGRVVDLAQYPTPVPQGKSYALLENGWHWTSVLTPGAQNAPDAPPPVVVAAPPVASVPAALVTPAPIAVAPIIPAPTTAPAPTAAPTFSALLPNPSDNAANEWMEITNNSSSTLALDGWTVVDAAQKVASLKGVTIIAGETIRLPKSITKITLNNDTEEVRILDPAGVMRDGVRYTNAPSGGVYRKEGDMWVWSTAPTTSTLASATIAESGSSDPGTTTPGPDEVQIAEIDGVESATPITFSGIVTLLPGVLGKTTFAVMDQGGGAATFVRIRAGGAAPVLKKGDLVQIAGKKSSNAAYGVAAAWQDVHVLGKGSAARPIEKNPLEIGPEDAGLEVRLRGVVSGRGKRWMSLADETAEREVRVTFMGSDAPPAKPGDSAVVTGVVRFKNDVAGLLAVERSAAVVTPAVAETAAAQPASEPPKQKNAAQTLVLAAQAERPVIGYAALGMTAALGIVGYVLWKRRRYAVFDEESLTDHA